MMTGRRAGAAWWLCETHLIVDWDTTDSETPCIRSHYEDPYGACRWRKVVVLPDAPRRVLSWTGRMGPSSRPPPAHDALAGDAAR